MQDTQRKLKIPVTPLSRNSHNILMFFLPISFSLCILQTLNQTLRTVLFLGFFSFLNISHAIKNSAQNHLTGYITFY